MSFVCTAFALKLERWLRCLIKSFLWQQVQPSKVMRFCLEWKQQTFCSTFCFFSGKSTGSFNKYVDKKKEVAHCGALAHMPTWRYRELRLHESHINKKPYFYQYCLPSKVLICENVWILGKFATKKPFFST